MRRRLEELDTGERGQPVHQLVLEGWIAGLWRWRLPLLVVPVTAAHGGGRVVADREPRLGARARLEVTGSPGTAHFRRDPAGIAGAAENSRPGTRGWNASQAYAEPKLHVVALALAAARAWPGVLSSAVDPGWVATKMGGPGASGDLETGSRTQAWLAVSNDPAAAVSGGYWHHQQRQAPAPEARDPAFQDKLMDRLAALTGIKLF